MSVRHHSWSKKIGGLNIHVNWRVAGGQQAALLNDTPQSFLGSSSGSSSSKWQ
jgi:hypothetical protein